MYLLFTGRDVLAIVWFVGYIFFSSERVMADMYEGFFMRHFGFGVLLYLKMSVVNIPYLLYSTFLLTYYFSISFYQLLYRTPTIIVCTLELLSCQGVEWGKLHTSPLKWEPQASSPPPTKHLYSYVPKNNRLNDSCIHLHTLHLLRMPTYI